MTSVPFLFFFVLTDAILLKQDLQKGHRFWAILQMKSCLSIKNGKHIKKLETYYFFHILKPP